MLKRNRKLWQGVALCMGLSLILGGCSLDGSGQTDNQSTIEVYRSTELEEGFVKVAENEFLELHFESVSAQIAVKNKETDKIWYSNPQDIESDPLANKFNKEKLKSQVTVVVNGPKGDPIEMNSYTYSVDYGQFKYEEIENGLKVTYTIGKQDDIYCLPQAITEARFEEMILSNLEDGPDKTAVINCYKKNDISLLEDEKDKKEIIEQYPLAESQVVYTLREGQPEFRLEQISNAILSTGYTFEDKKVDEEENGLGKGEENPKFIIPIEYTLEDDNFLVRVPMEEVKGTAGYPIVNIRLLEYFEAAGIEDEGYIMVPDGSGALINFNNQKTNMPLYSGKVYGDDGAIEKVESLGAMEQVYFPVYGMKFEDEAFLAIIESGTSVASIEADISGRVHSYNTVYANFNTIPNQKMRMPAKSGDEIINVYQKDLISEDLVVRYKFLEDATYVDMAKHYQEYLLEEGKLTKQTIDDVPFIVEYVGAIDKEQHVLGLPVRMTEPLTTYQQAEAITQQLLDGGIETLDVRYTGMFNEGVFHTLPNKLSNVSQLGDNGDREQMQAFMQENGILLYPEFNTQMLQESRMFDGFFSYVDSARLITKEMATYRPYNSAIYLLDITKQKSIYMTPPFSLEVVQDMTEELQDKAINAVSLGELGRTLHSDFNEKRLVDREESKAVSIAQFEEVVGAGMNLMVRGGNDYTLPYASVITDMPLESGKSNILDEDIPFMQLVVHGYIPYTSEALNLTKNYEHELLKSIETGAGLSYTWMYAESEVLKDTDYSHYYSISYANWIDEAVDIYNQLQKDLGDIHDVEMTNHQEVADDVYKVSYANGKDVYVNYNDEAVTIGDVVIPKESYCVVEGGGE